MFSPQKIVHWKIFFGLWKQLALPFFEVGNMSSSFGGFNFHQVRSKKSVATAVSTRDSQGGVRHWLVETRGWETATGNGWRYQAGWNSEGWRLYVYIYIYMYCTWIHGLSWVDGRAGCVVISQETMGIAWYKIREQLGARLSIQVALNSSYGPCIAVIYLWSSNFWSLYLAGKNVRAILIYLWSYNFWISQMASSSWTPLNRLASLWNDDLPIPEPPPSKFLRLIKKPTL